MPKFLDGCHYNEEEISQHLKKNLGYWPVQIHGWQQVCNRSNPGKAGRSCEEADFRWLNSKVSRSNPAPSSSTDQQLEPHLVSPFIEQRRRRRRRRRHNKRVALHVRLLISSLQPVAGSHF